MVSIAELVDYPDKAPASVGEIVTNQRLRMTKNGEKMAWCTVADATGPIECAVFPNAYERLGQLGQDQSLREGAFLVARSRLAQQEATGSKLFIDEIVNLHPGAWASALVISIQESSDASSATNMRTGLARAMRLLRASTGRFASAVGFRNPCVNDPESRYELLVF